MRSAVAAAARGPPCCRGWTPRRGCGRVQDAVVAAVSGDRADRSRRPAARAAARRTGGGQGGRDRPGPVSRPLATPTGWRFRPASGRPRSLARHLRTARRGDRPGFMPPGVWSLDGWARQGVLLLNPVLTVEVGRSGSHLALRLAGAHSRDRSRTWRHARRRRSSCSGARQARALLGEAARPAGSPRHACLTTRHPVVRLRAARSWPTAATSRATGRPRRLVGDRPS